MTKKNTTADTAAEDVDDPNATTAAGLGRRERAILAMLSTPTLRAAADVSGVPERTLRRWLTEPDFAELLAQARKQSVVHASTRLVAACGSAAEVLVAVAEDTGAPPAARVSAARTVLEMARGFVVLEDLEARLRRVEEGLPS